MKRADDWPLERTLAHLHESARIKKAAAQECAGDILEAARMLVDVFEAGGKLLLCGNGGSAADCQHLAAEFTSRLTIDFERPALPAIALTTDTSFLTAFANDCGYEGIFERQVSALGKTGDVLFGISTSGNSKNVVLAVEAAKELKMKTIALCGEGGVLPEMVDVAVSVPSNKTQYIQEAHLAVEHIICDLVERLMFAGLIPERRGGGEHSVEEGSR